MTTAATDEQCRCGHGESQHDGDAYEGEPGCTSPTTEWWERTYDSPCDCPRFREPDNG